MSCARSCATGCCSRFVHAARGLPLVHGPTRRGLRGPARRRGSSTRPRAAVGARVSEARPLRACPGFATRHQGDRDLASRARGASPTSRTPRWIPPPPARRARRRWRRARGRCGRWGGGGAGCAVTFVQRFGSALNRNVHLHTVVSDGTFAIQDRPSFVALPPPPPRRSRRCWCASSPASDATSRAPATPTTTRRVGECLKPL